MPRACSICTNVKSSEITKALASGMPFRELASRYNVTSTSSQRHLANCLKTRRQAQKLNKLQKPRAEKSGTRVALSEKSKTFRYETEADPRALISRAETLLASAEEIVVQAQADGNTRLALQAIDRARMSLDQLLKVHGLLSSDSAATTIVDQRRQTVQLFGRLTEGELRALARGEPIAEDAMTSLASENM
jgi:arginine utilization protein RocB